MPRLRQGSRDRRETQIPHGGQQNPGVLVQLLDKQEEEANSKVRVAKDSASKAVFAHAVKAKGVSGDGVAVKALVDDLRWLGYSHVVLKSDNEKAILNVLRAAMREYGTNGTRTMSYLFASYWRMVHRPNSPMITSPTSTITKIQTTLGSSGSVFAIIVPGMN